MRSRGGAGSRQRGTTLVEALIATGLVAAIAVGAAQMVQTTVKFAARLDNGGRADDDFDRGRRALVSLLERTVRPDDSERWRFVGSVRTATFTTLGEASESPMRVELRIEFDEGGRESLVAANLDLPGASAVVMSGLANGRFAYYDAAAHAWRADWRRPAPPALIRIEGTGADDEEVSMEFRPRADGVHRCVFDAVSRRCRS